MGLFITMNPGYAGRAELPDNLKALFRPVAAMVPDYALIAEIRLFSFGFAHGESLAKKMTATFRLCSQQLSSQSHYDFGMRAVNSVIQAAGNLRQAAAQAQDPVAEAEDQLLLRALRQANLPKFLGPDAELFEGIVGDLFPGMEQLPEDVSALTAALHSSAEALGLVATPVFVQKCIQFQQTLVLRHGLMLVGPAGGGKTAIYRCLARALEQLHHSRVAITAFNPKAVPLSQLYGAYDDVTHEWADGVLASVVRMHASATDEAQARWIVMDGPVDALWIENMNTVLDDNKKLCLASGEVIALTPAMRMIFEVADLAVASPATVSRCGMVFVEAGPTVPVTAHIEAWFRNEKNVPRPLATHEGGATLVRIRALIDALLPKLCDLYERR